VTRCWHYNKSPSPTIYLFQKHITRQDELYSAFFLFRHNLYFFPLYSVIIFVFNFSFFSRLDELVWNRLHGACSPWNRLSFCLKCSSTCHFSNCPPHRNAFFLCLRLIVPLGGATICGALSTVRMRWPKLQTYSSEKLIYWPGYLAADLTNGETGFESRQEQQSFHFSTPFRPATGSIQPPVQWLPAALSVKGIKLTTYLHLVKCCLCA
jgi:hypothetical protein